MESNVKYSGIKITLVMDAKEALWLKKMCQNEPQPLKETPMDKETRQSFFHALPAFPTLDQYIDEY